MPKRTSKTRSHELKKPVPENSIAQDPVTIAYYGQENDPTLPGVTHFQFAPKAKMENGPHAAHITKTYVGELADIPMEDYQSPDGSPRKDRFVLSMRTAEKLRWELQRVPAGADISDVVNNHVAKYSTHGERITKPAGKYNR